MTYADTFTWQGDRFERRPNQSTKVIYSRRRRRKRETIEYNRDWTNHHVDGIDLGVLVFVEKISIIDEYLIGSPRTPFHFSRQMFVIAITNANEIDFEENAMNVLKKLWIDYGIGNVILITPCNGDPEVSSVQNNLSNEI